MSAKPTPLDSGYTAEFDTVTEKQWEEILTHFTDANIYQTWPYDAVRCGEKNLGHLVLRFDGQVVSVAQVRLVRIPGLGVGAAYLRWGPLWQGWNQEPEPSVFRLALRSLRNEYVCRRGLILRIFPLVYDDNSNFFSDILLQEGYSPVPEESRGRTLVMDISQPLDEVRKKFDQKWRNCLNKSERNNLEVIEGTDDRLFAEFIGLYHALLERKQFQEPNDINEFRMIQQSLTNEYKMRIFLCRENGLNSAGAICAAIGDTGVYIFGATNNEGMKNKGSYLLQWKAIQWMKESGCLYYNLNGINPEKNPGGYHFKAGLSGKNGRDVYYLGRFDCYSNALTAKLALSADALLPSMKKILGKIAAPR
ncbi:lipid II:glycine glycyltransferase FemX [Syntrophus buswellii]|uniref:lipid II:glycine glycyltransferase FemX n=1 Tax=Syntrophus buswellii TaxID=43774 RepID=UPI0038D39954